MHPASPASRTSAGSVPIAVEFARCAWCAGRARKRFEKNSRVPLIQVIDHSLKLASMSMNLPAAEAAEVRAKYGSVFTAVQQIVVAGSIDEEDNFFEAEADGEGLGIDEVNCLFLLVTITVLFVRVKTKRQHVLQAAVMQIIASFEAPIELLSVNKRTATEIKFEVQNTAGGRKAAFILGFKGGDVGARFYTASPHIPFIFSYLFASSMQRSAAPTRRNASRTMTFINLFCVLYRVECLKRERLCIFISAPYYAAFCHGFHSAANHYHVDKT